MAEADAWRPVTGPLETTDFIRDRAVEAVLGQSALNHDGLTKEIRRKFGSSDARIGALVREPVIEGAAPFISSGRTFSDFSGAPLHPDVIRAISSDSAGHYRFPPDAQPYQHQVEAWEHLTAEERRSVLVSSGTGSGKTECFLMPLLHDLATEAAGSSKSPGRLSGVRALMLYPLNALIASQEERLRAWTAPFGGSLRFGLYNGMTPEKLRARDMNLPEQAEDRFTLRNDPPPILLTNVTMLEYMTVRQIDRPLLENSRGKLRWIILDEAHGYIGSAAAEIALLIRRVLLAFGVSAEDVRFVATSATIGDGKDVTDELRRFLRDLSGVDERRVHVVLGNRESTPLPAPGSNAELLLASLTDRAELSANPAVQKFVRAAEEGPVSLSEANTLLAPTRQPIERVLVAVAARQGEQRSPLLPLRVHNFMRAVPGLWSCLNAECLESPDDWAFGAIATERVDNCPSCRSPVLEVMTCRECGEPYLDGVERDDHLQARITPPTQDEFAALREREIEADESNSLDDDDTEVTADSDQNSRDPVHRAIAVRPLPEGGVATHIVLKTGEIRDRADDDTNCVNAHDPDACGACRAHSGKNGSLLRPFRYGAPFLIGNAAPVLLEGVPPSTPDHKPNFRLPAEGRQLLSFTDSRQGTARFAANLQTNAERGFVRGFIYHSVQGSMMPSLADDGAVQKLRDEIATLESIIEINAAIVDLIDAKRSDLEALERPSTSGVRWLDMRRNLAAQPELHHWIAKVWGSRDDRFKQGAEALAEFMLLREFNRRPRRGNTVETMGLARLRFPAIDKLKRAPEALLRAGKTVADWRGLLYSMVDMTIRGQFAIRVTWDDIHWLHTNKPLTNLLAPGTVSDSNRDLNWPFASARKGLPSNLVMIIERALGLDRMETADRNDINTLFEEAWTALRPILSDPSLPDYALDFRQAYIAPVLEAWHCPVTGRVLPELALGHTQYGHREGLRTAEVHPSPIMLPKLPITFPRGEELGEIRQWLRRDCQIEQLRKQGVWSNLHDRVSMLSPYMRAAEHSAQQPPARLRRFEGEFKRGEINILNCSTTMEMGVDIGSISAVMMTNVPPALANYRQRVGRAGRRGQGFAFSLTYSRDNPLDREAFADPKVYLARTTRAPKVKLDSRRIVQRHVNAYLLASWFAEEGGELMKTHAGDFFGFPEAIGAAAESNAPVDLCMRWMAAPTTLKDHRHALMRLTKGTILESDKGIAGAAIEALTEARASLERDWSAMQAQALTVPPEAKNLIAFQLQRLVRESLLKELAVRAVLPGHGFPTNVVPFVNREKSAKDGQGPKDGSQQRRSYPTRNLDIAIRDYAPGAEVVVDGLVYHSAGVTLNWKRPADDDDAREIQNLKTFWSCLACGASDCDVKAPEHCPSCHAVISPDAVRRFLEPAGFTADMQIKPHADTDQVHYVEPEAEQIAARGAPWVPFADPQQGRMRASNEGMVFYSSRGASKFGYQICLECGRAEPAQGKGGSNPLNDHQPLRFTKRNAAGLCPGNDKPFKITQPLALGHETVTDVAEIQPVGLPTEGAAWAAVSALREALCRSLGIETGEIGMSVRPGAISLGRKTYSLFLYDRASGGAGFSPQAVTLFETLLPQMVDILDCAQKGCQNGCSACVLARDLYRQHEIVDRRSALEWARPASISMVEAADEDQAANGAKLSRSLADDIAAAADFGIITTSIFVGPGSDVAALERSAVGDLAKALAARGSALEFVVPKPWLSSIDHAARLSLRDFAKSHGIAIFTGTAPEFPNGAVGLAAISGTARVMWASRDRAAQDLGDDWGLGSQAPVVRFASSTLTGKVPVSLDSLLPPSGTQFMELADELDGTLADFGDGFASILLPKIRSLSPSGQLASIEYSDRYLQSPLVIRLMSDALAALAKRLGETSVDQMGNGEAEKSKIPVQIVTRNLRPNNRQPFRPHHDWEWPDDRKGVLLQLLQNHGFDPELIEGEAAHGRSITLRFSDDQKIRIILDQGFGLWQTPNFAKFDFGDTADRQASKLARYAVLLTSRGRSYAVVLSD